MIKLGIPNSLSRSLHNVGFQLKKHSPEILVATGVVGMVGAAVLACRATTKVSAVLENAKSQINDIHEVANDPKFAEEYTEQDKKKDLTVVYAQTGLQFVKLYGPAVLLGAGSIACIFGGHNILRKRNLALAAAYATVETGFKEYRERVVERFGKELDRELKYNIKSEEVEETVIDENGNEKTVKTTVTTFNPNDYSDFARVFDDGCTGWTKSPEDNLIFLKLQQAHANDILQRKGRLFLNEVYEMLGFPATKAGQVVGWIYDEKHPVGDNYVDFGIYNLDNERSRAFINGHERNIILDFNVDGNIWELMA